jgi:hypothetical protein
MTKSYTLAEVNVLLMVMMECAMHARKYKCHHDSTDEEYAEWVRKQLTSLGYDVDGPVGLCWIRLNE